MTTQPCGARDVSARIELAVHDGADLVLSFAIAPGYGADETIDVAVDGVPVRYDEVITETGSRLHRVRSAPTGRLVVDYAAHIGRGAEPARVSDLDPITFSWPSRYCDSDRLGAVAASHFGGAAQEQVVDAVRRWILTNITYVPGRSDVTDGALETYLAREGVCRDSAHLAIAFLRARGVPARLVSVYAPGLVPMDFHAVVEVLVDGRWLVIDGTGLAPRPSMVRIATGRDAADTAFVTVLSGRADLISVQADAHVDVLPDDDGASPVQLT